MLPGEKNLCLTSVLLRIAMRVVVSLYTTIP